jgi:hypothetical protein
VREGGGSWRKIGEGGGKIFVKMWKEREELG